MKYVFLFIIMLLSLSIGFSYTPTSDSYLDCNVIDFSFVNISDCGKSYSSWMRYYYINGTDDIGLLYVGGDINHITLPKENLGKYDSNYLNTPTNKCNVTLTGSGSNYILKSNLKHPSINNNLFDIPNNLTHYYYMKTNVKAELINSTGSIVHIIHPSSSSDGIVWANYGSIDFNFNFNSIISNLQYQCNSGVSSACGDYYWKITATPIDGKCDFGNDGSLTGDVLGNTKYSNGTNMFTSPTQAKFTISKDSDGDNIPDSSDLCQKVPGISKYRGCPYKYTQINCTGDISTIEIDELNSKVYCKNHYDMGIFLGNSFYDYHRELNQGNPFDYGISSNLIGSGFYSCDNDNHNFYDSDNNPISSCNVRLNTAINCNNGNGFTLSNGDSINLFKYKHRLPIEKSDTSFSRTITCHNGDFIYNGNIISNFGIYSKFFTNQLGSDYNDFKRAADGSIYKDDGVTQGKITCGSLNENINDCNVLIGQNKEPITLPTTTTPKTIKIYKQGVLVRNDTIDAKLIAMSVQSIKPFSSKTKIQNYVDKSYTLMNQFDIEKHLNYDSINNKTTVTLKLKNIPSSDKTDLVIYQIISKKDVSNFNNIKFLSAGDGEVIVEDKDPVIGWYFNDSQNNEVVNYTVPGNVEGGTIVITQDPILLNQGELVINYRENGCQGDETPLFDLNSLENSNVYPANSGKLYTVCITDVNSTIASTISNKTLGSPTKDLDISSFNLNMSTNYSKLSNKVHLSTTTNDIYWDLLIQNTNPDGNYSCIGSFNDGYKTNDVTFGDCGFKANNRLWIHLGADYYPPNTTISFPYLSHTTKVVLDVKDNIGGSGVNTSSYKIDNGNWINYTTHAEFTLTCPSDWGCKHVIQYKSQDNAGNNESIKTYNLNILDKASACESSCLSKPSPDRYIKECRNLNSCKYYSINNLGINDDGLYVANQCDFQLKDSKVYYNSTHDIVCPNGPIVKSTRSTDQFNVLNSYCDNIKTTSYPVLLNGEQVLLDVVSCIDPYKKLN